MDERDTPMWPIDVYDAYGDATLSCPVCRKPVHMPLNIQWAGNFPKTIKCRGCGQRMYWN